MLLEIQTLFLTKNNYRLFSRFSLVCRKIYHGFFPFISLKRKATKRLRRLSISHCRLSVLVFIELKNNLGSSHYKWHDKLYHEKNNNVSCLHHLFAAQTSSTFYYRIYSTCSACNDFVLFCICSVCCGKYVWFRRFLPLFYNGIF